MDQQAKLAIFEAQVSNVRSLKSAMRQVHRSINDGFRRKDQPKVDAFTRAYAMMFCAWAEANFSKVLHTPHAFEIDEIQQVHSAKANGIAVAWKKCVELGLRHLDAKRGNFRPNARQKLEKAIDAHIFDPSILRNKLAHGQWTVALNRENNSVQPDLTNKINELDIVKIDAWIKGHQLLADVVEHLIESPKKAFMRDWYAYVVQIEDQMVEADKRTLQQHIQRLRQKDELTRAKDKRRN